MYTKEIVPFEESATATIDYNLRVCGNEQHRETLIALFDAIPGELPIHGRALYHKHYKVPAIGVNVNTYAEIEAWVIGLGVVPGVMLRAEHYLPGVFAKVEHATREYDSVTAEPVLLEMLSDIGFGYGHVRASWYATVAGKLTLVHVNMDDPRRHRSKSYFGGRKGTGELFGEASYSEEEVMDTLRKAGVDYGRPWVYRHRTTYGSDTGNIRITKRFMNTSFPLQTRVLDS